MNDEQPETHAHLNSSPLDAVIALAGTILTGAAERPYVITDTGQTNCYGVVGGIIPLPAPNEALHGQDEQSQGPHMAFRNHDDDTVVDLNTGLLWQKEDSGSALNWSDALPYAEQLDLAGHGTTGGGSTLWTIQEAAPGRVLGELVDQDPNHHLNIAIHDRTCARNVALAVRFRAVTTREEGLSGVIRTNRIITSSGRIHGRTTWCCTKCRMV